MKGIVLYQSKYGSTKKYAEWLKEATGYDCIETKKSLVSDILAYQLIILAGGIYASGIAGLPFLKKNIEKLSGKRIAIFCVGASPFDEAAFEQVRERNLKGQLKNIPCFYGRGAWDEKSMSFKDRALCTLLQKAVAKKNPSSYEPWERALMSAVGKSCDWTDKAYLQALLEWIKTSR